MRSISLTSIFAGVQTPIYSDGTLTVTNGLHTARIGLSGDYTSASWTLSNDGHGGTDLVDPPSLRPCTDPVAGTPPADAHGIIPSLALLTNYTAAFTPSGFGGEATLLADPTAFP